MQVILDVDELVRLSLVTKPSSQADYLEWPLPNLGHVQPVHDPPLYAQSSWAAYTV